MWCYVVRKPSQYKEVSVCVLAGNPRQAPSQQLQATHVSEQSLKMLPAFTFSWKGLPTEAPDIMEQRQTILSDALSETEAKEVINDFILF